MEHPPYTQLERGTLMIANPDLNTGTYLRSIVLLCEHNQEGSLGIMLNKKLNFTLPEEALHLTDATNQNIGTGEGGPLQPNQMMLLHGCADTSCHTLRICDGVYLGGDLSFCQELLHTSDGPPIRMYFGYSGWGPGQLAREFLSGAWFIHPSSQRLVFSIPADKLWQEALREMGGKYATLSMIPEDLSLN